MSGRRPLRIGRSKTVLFAALALGTSLAVCEAAVRLLVPAPWYHRLYEDGLMTSDPVRTYALAPNRTHHWVARDWDIDIRVDENGLRDSPLADARRADLRILALGDSFTFGLGVAQDASWPEVLERELARRATPSAVSVVNAGVPAYSARQMRETAEALVPELRPRIVVFALYASSYWRVADPYVLYGGHLVVSDSLKWAELTPSGDLVYTPYGPGRIRALDVWLKEHFEIGAHLLTLAGRLRAAVGGSGPGPSGPEADASKIRADYRPALDEIAATDRVARANGAKLVVMAVNHQEADGGFAPTEPVYNDVLREYCASAGIPFVDPLPELEAEAAGRPKFCFPHNLHWTPAAHRVAAEVLLRALDRGGLLEGSAQPDARSRSKLASASSSRP